MLGSKLLLFWKKLKKITKPDILYFIMLLFALMLCSAVIYIRFLRTRLPRDIPFNLTLFWLGVLLAICALYLYLIKKLILPRNPRTMVIELIQYFIRPITYIITSLKTLDSAIRNNKYLHPANTRFVSYLMLKVLDFSGREIILLYYIFVIVPGYILLLVFILDVFWFKRIAIFYYFIFLHILPLVHGYYTYLLSILREKYLTDLESKYDLVIIQDNNSIDQPLEDRNPNAIYHDQYVSVRKYFDIQLEHLRMHYLEKDEAYNIVYVGQACNKDEIYAEYRIKHNKVNTTLTMEDYNILEKEFVDIEPKLRGLMEYIYLIYHVEKTYYIKELKIIMYSLYLICWIYILYKSIHTLPQNLSWLYYGIMLIKDYILHNLKIKPLTLIKTLTIITILGYVKNRVDKNKKDENNNDGETKNNF